MWFNPTRALVVLIHQVAIRVQAIQPELPLLKVNLVRRILLRQVPLHVQVTIRRRVLLPIIHTVLLHQVIPQAARVVAQVVEVRVAVREVVRREAVHRVVVADKFKD